MIQTRTSPLRIQVVFYHPGQSLDQNSRSFSQNCSLCSCLMIKDSLHFKVLKESQQRISVTPNIANLQRLKFHFCENKTSMGENLFIMQVGFTEVTKQHVKQSNLLISLVEGSCGLLLLISNSHVQEDDTFSHLLLSGSYLTRS